MTEPLHWNPLPDAARWLTECTGTHFDVLSLLDRVIQISRPGNPEASPIQALLPRNIKLARIVLVINDDDLQKAPIHQWLTSAYGTLPFNRAAYVGEVYRLATYALNGNHLVDLALYKEVEILLLTNEGIDKSLNGGHMREEGETVWVMPYGSKHIATLDSCGIFRSDLVDLARRIAVEPRKQPAAEPSELPAGNVESTPAAWHVNRPKKMDAISRMTFDALTEALEAGEPRPKATEVFAWIEKNRASDFISRFGDEIKFVTDTGSEDSITVESMRKRIWRMTE